MSKARLAAVAIVLGLACGEAQGGAFLLERGTGQVITTFAGYRSDGGYDVYGFPVKSGYAKTEFESYVEYGALDNLTLGFVTRFRRVEQSTPAGAVSSSGLGETDLFARIGLWRGERTTLSIQGLVALPGPEKWPATGEPQRDIEARVLVGHGFTVLGREGFGDLSLAYRRRGGIAADQYRIDGTLGIRPWPRLLIMAQSFTTIGAGNEGMDAFGVRGSDYDTTKLQGSFVYDVNDRFSLQIGAYADVHTRAMEAGRAAFAALWVRF